MDCLYNQAHLVRLSSEIKSIPYLKSSRITYDAGLSKYEGRVALGIRVLNLTLARLAQPIYGLPESQVRFVSPFRMCDSYSGKGGSVTGQGVRTMASTSTSSPPIHDSDQQITGDNIAELLGHIRQFYMPELSSYFPVKCHPDYNEISEQIKPWLLEWKRPRTDEERELLLQSNLHGVVCLTIPESQHKYRISLVCKLVTWICSFDDASDETQQLGADAKAVKQVNEHIKLVLQGRDTNNDLDRPEIKVISSVLRELRADMSPTCHQRHADTLISGLFSFEEQADVRQSSGMLDVPTYISTRRRTFLFNHIRIMIEYCLGVELDEETLQMDCMQQLHDAAGDYIAWTNDLISFRREYFQGDYQNLPCVVYLNSGGQLDFQQAVYKVCEMIRARERDFIRIFHEISLSDITSRNPDLRIYLRNLPYVLSGHLHWYYTSARFHGLGNSMGKVREGMLQMIPEKTVVVPVEDHVKPKIKAEALMS
eukprot:c27057_g1_i1 orf=459-1904(-)